MSLVRAWDPGPVKSLRESYFDQLQRLAPRQAEDLPVRVVDIDEQSLAEHGQWPWPRHMMATLTERLIAMGAAVVVYDLIFAEPDRLSAAQLLDDPLVARTVRGATWLSNLDELDYDRIFAETIEGWPVVLGTSDAGSAGNPPLAPKAGFVEVGAGAAALPALRSATGLVPALYASTAGLGGINVSPSTDDGIIRSVPLVWRTDKGFMPSLALEGLRVALGESTIVIISDASDTSVEAVRLGGYDIPTDQNGLLRVHYRVDDPDLYVPARDVFDLTAEGRVGPRLEGHIVLIGTSAAGLLDIRTTALGAQVPGVSIHAQIVEQILLESYLTRTLTQDGSEILIFVALSLIVFLVLLRLGPLASVIVGSVAGAGTLAASWLFYTQANTLFDATFPMIGSFLVFFALTVFRFALVDREKRLIRQSFSKYVAPTILQEIEAKGHDLKLGGDMRDVSVLFADIRDFTPLSASMSPEELVALLNELFSDLTEEILSGRGTVDKYIGDSIMAFWNAPVEIEDHRRHACLATIRMRERLRMFSETRTSGHQVRMATGLASGMACVGNMGSRDRFNYSVIGSVVNEAARVEAACRHVAYDILASDSVAEGARDLALLPAGALMLKGIENAVPTSIVVGDDALAQSKKFKELASAHDRLIDCIIKGTPNGEYLESCRRQAQSIEPGLDEFYLRLVMREDDFSERPATAVAQPAQVRA